MPPLAAMGGGSASVFAAQPMMAPQYAGAPPCGVSGYGGTQAPPFAVQVMPSPASSVCHLTACSSLLHVAQLAPIHVAQDARAQVSMRLTSCRRQGAPHAERGSKCCSSWYNLHLRCAQAYPGSLPAQPQQSYPGSFTAQTQQSYPGSFTAQPQYSAASYPGAMPGAVPAVYGYGAQPGYLAPGAGYGPGLRPGQISQDDNCSVM